MLFKSHKVYKNHKVIIINIDNTNNFDYIYIAKIL